MNTDQSFYQAGIEFSDNSEMMMEDTWEVFANRKDQYGIPATYNVGTFRTEGEAQEMADEINS